MKKIITLLIFSLLVFGQTTSDNSVPWYCTKTVRVIVDSEELPLQIKKLHLYICNKKNEDIAKWKELEGVVAHLETAAIDRNGKTFIYVYDIAQTLENGNYYFYACWETDALIKSGFAELSVKKDWFEPTPPGGCVLMR